MKGTWGKDGKKKEADGHREKDKWIKWKKTLDGQYKKIFKK